MATELNAWAETVVHARGNNYPPAAGEECAFRCGRVFARGDRAFRVIERKDDDWVCEGCKNGAPPDGK